MVQLKIPAWVASMWGSEVSGWIILEKEIGEGATIGDLLTDLVKSHAYLQKVVFNQDTRKVSDQIMVFLNETLLQDPEVSKYGLREGDIITLLPVYAGG